MNGSPSPQDPAMMPPPPMPPEGAAPSGEGTVMMQMPREAFMAIHQLVVQLAQGLDALAASVDQQAAGEQDMSAAMMDEAAAAGAGAPPDEAELAAFAEELSQRGIV